MVGRGGPRGSGYVHPLNAELNPICHLLALLGGATIVVVSRLGVKAPDILGRQPNAPAAFTPEEIPGTHIQRLSRPQGTWFCRKEPRKKSQVPPPIPGLSD